MKSEQAEKLRQVWRERFTKVVEVLAGPLTDVLETLSATEAEAKALALEKALLQTRLNEQSPQPGKRKNPLWAWNKRMRGR